MQSKQKSPLQVWQLYFVRLVLGNSHTFHFLALADSKAVCRRLKKHFLNEFFLPSSVAREVQPPFFLSSLILSSRSRSRSPRGGNETTREATTHEDDNDIEKPPMPPPMLDEHEAAAR
jgi:hypothetical protein